MTCPGDFSRQRSLASSLLLYVPQRPVKSETFRSHVKSMKMTAKKLNQSSPGGDADDSGEAGTEFGDVSQRATCRRDP